MSEIDELPADQRAVLQLLLQQGKSYDELAGMLSMDVAVVRQRAHAALDALGPESGARLTSERRGEVADYLLGQQADTAREGTRNYLAGSAGARSWARPVAGTLRPLAGEAALPEIPDEGEEAADAAEPEPAEAEAPTATAAEPAAPAPSEAAAVAEPKAAAAEPTVPPPPSGPRRPSSRLGGALLLGGAAILVAVVLVLVISGGGGGKSKKKSDTLSSTPTQSTNAPQPIAQINLLPTASGSKAVGLAQVFAQGNSRVVIIAGQGLKAGAYAIWLYSSQTKARLLGFVPNRVGKDGRFVTRGELPGDATGFSQLVVTTERVPKNAKALPTKPGAIVLRGRLQIS
jgi:hypothetical protein